MVIEIGRTTKVELDRRFFEPVTNQFENLHIGPFRIVKSWCVYKNDARSVSLVVQNAISREILSDGGEAISSPTPLLASESVNDLVPS